MIRIRKSGILSTILVAAILAGCANSAPAVTTGEEAAEAVEEAASETAESEEKASEDAGAAEEEAPEDSGVTTGGSPWLDSSIKANLTEDMDLSLKDDLYLALNYDWIMSTDIPEGKYIYSTFEEAGERIEENIVKLMDDDTVTGREAELSKTLYHALIDWEARDKTGFEPAREKIAAIKEIRDTEELTSFLCDMDNSCFVPLGTDVWNDTFFDDSSRYIVKIDDIHKDLILRDSSEYKKRSGVGEVYYKAAKELSEAMLIRAGFSEDEAGRIFEGAIAFETLLAEDIPVPEELSTPEYYEAITNLYDMDSLKELYKAYPIVEILNARGYGGQEQYQVTTPDYAAKLGSLYNEENLEKIKNYMLVNFCLSAANKLDREAFQAYNRYRNEIYGSSGKLSDSYFAVRMVRSYLPDAITKAYVDHYHLEETKVRIDKLCKDIISVYIDMLREEEWLSDEMKERAVEKLQCMEVHAVYPDKWIDYDSLKLTGDSLYGYCEQIETFSKRLDASRTGRAVDRGEWNFMHDSMDPLCVNAFNNEMLNAIYIFAGHVEDPIYREGMSDEELYGNMGCAIGHEISHAFDSAGSQYDKDGNLKNWWPEEDRKAFDERAEKLKKYYDTITIWTGLNASGELDQNELIADMGAVKAMLRLARDKEDFDYEAFFKALAVSWRCVTSRESEYHLAALDTHPPYYLRSNVAAQQFEEFYETFGVKEGDGMYLAPEDRVAVW